jgi:hypothetical protein
MAASSWVLRVEFESLNTMKQILQNIKTGTTEIVEVPAPSAGRGVIVIQSSRSLVSAGTERMLVDFGKAGWIEKALTDFWSNLKSVSFFAPCPFPPER